MKIARKTIDTLGKLLEEGWTVDASCEHDHTCTHIAPLDLKALIRRYGADYPFVERRATICAALRCTRCGRQGAQIRTSPPSWSLSAGGRAAQGGQR